METNIIKGFEQQDKIDLLRQVLSHLRRAHILIDNKDLRYDEHPAYTEKLIDAYDKISQSVFHTSDAIADLISWDLSGETLAEPSPEIQEPDNNQSKKMEIVHKTKKTA